MIDYSRQASPHQTNLLGEFSKQMRNRLTQRILDELERIQAPPAITRLALSLSFFQDPDAQACEYQFFLAEAISALLETGGLQ